MAIDDNTSYELTGYQVKDLAQRIRGKADDDVFVGAGSAVAGSRGLVPAPAAGDNTKFLSGDGTWKDVSGGSSTVHKILFQTNTESTLYHTLPVASERNVMLLDEEYGLVTIGQLVAMLMKGEQVVFVPNDESNVQNRQRGIISSWAANINPNFDPTDPEDNDIYSLTVDIHVTTFLGGCYDLTLYKDWDSWNTGLSVSVREGDTVSFVAPLYAIFSPGAFDDLRQLVNDETWYMATTNAEAWILDQILGNSIHADYLSTFLLKIVEALCQGKKIALKAAVIRDTNDGPPIVATVYVFDSFSLEPTDEGFSYFTSVGDFVSAIKQGLANLRLYGVGRFLGDAHLITLEFTGNGATLIYG